MCWNQKIVLLPLFTTFWSTLAILVKNMIFAWNVKMGVKSSLFYVQLCAETKK